MGSYSKSIVPEISKKQESGSGKEQNPLAQLKDNREEHAMQLKFSGLANSRKGKDAVQRIELEEEELQMKAIEEDELQLKSVESSNIPSIQNPLAAPVQRVENNTGLPDQLKSGVENLSGYSMDDVNVHYNSSKPSQLQAHAYAQGTDIHVAPGQEQHLPHEAWHVVQQKQGRVRATRQLKGKVNINDDAGLEKEADVMGSRSIQSASKSKILVDGLASGKMNMSIAQRNKDSAEALSDMAEPKVGQQDIELAQSIHDQLESIYANTIEKEDDFTDMRKKSYNSAVCLGGLIFPALEEGDDVKELFMKTDLVNLGKGSVGLGIYELLPEQLKYGIALNTLSTMADAGQLDYLKKSKFGTSKKSRWHVVVEIHYYRERPSTDNVFHKDTLGKTLFVNLNYLNNKKLVGPEYVVNPQDNPGHLANIAKTLPSEFLKDRETVMGELKDPQIIEVVEVPEYGYVAFVDEIIHHSSPTTQHRTVKGKDIRDYLLSLDKKQYDLYLKAYQKWKDRPAKKQNKVYGDYLRKKYLPDAQDWQTFFDNNDGASSYDRNEIRAMDPNKKFISDAKIDEMVHETNHRNFGEASIPNPGGDSFKSPMTPDNRHLTRRMSMNLDSGTMGTTDKDVGGRRSFFRTWVRAEKKDAQVTRDDWKWKDRGNM